MFGPITLFALLASVVKDCGGGKTLFKVNAVSISPVDPLPNDQVTLHLDYTVPDGLTVVGGQAKYAVVYNFIPMAPTVEPLCQNIPCPLGPGRYVNDTTSTWPSGLSGSVTTTITWADQDLTPLLCISIAVKV